MEAKFSKGVLKVVLPKSKEAKASTRKIEVKGG
jgi:HSP20 family molecular chaperone IbpA